ncbi:MAG: cupin domain-containing protein [Kosmotoga sp.]|nr:MAG: cupin domain-containing protein [Kosmotoga sp.]
MKDNIFVGDALSVDPKVLNNEEIKDVKKRILIGRNLGAPNFFMRLFVLAPGGHSPYHSHDWEHEVYVIKGKGKIITENREEEINDNSYVFVPPNVEHQFKNIGEDELHFICVIPSTADEE